MFQQQRGNNASCRPAGPDDKNPGACQIRRCFRFQRADISDPVRIVSGQNAIVIDHRVDRSDSHRAVINPVHIFHHRYLMRNGHVHPAESQCSDCLNGFT
ncbi:hypothetical protein D3C73_1465410 [compost metagenome]